MKRAMSILVLVTFAGAAAAQNHYYLTGDNDPWFNTTNDDAMNLAFGKGNWTKDNFNLINAKDIFNDKTECVYIDGGDSNAEELDKFLQGNLPVIENWVAGGHGLFLNCAPNEGGSFNFGFGGHTLNYPDFAVNPSNDGGQGANPIYNGPFTPVSGSYSGSAYAHASVSGGGTGLMFDADGGSPQLLDLTWGGGRVVFGGLTTSNFWSPNGNNEALNFRANIIDYVCTPVPTPGSAGLLGLAGLAAMRRRR
jgi:MYXO-CTERM domain-containing protein